MWKRTRKKQSTKASRRAPLTTREADSTVKSAIRPYRIEFQMFSYNLVALGRGLRVTAREGLGKVLSFYLRYVLPTLRGILPEARVLEVV